jgi:L-lactate utilization protein LutC
MNNWTTIPTDERINKTADALRANGISPIIVDSGKDAEGKIIALIPKGASVMNGSSTTLKEIGFIETLKENSPGWNNLHVAMLGEKDPAKQSLLAKQSTMADYYLGSVHAVTEQGTALIASNSGSQLPAYAFNAGHVIWIVGVQKIVSNLDEGIKRVYEYVLPLESERAHKAYGVPGSFVSKLLIFNKENVPDRITMILVKEPLGF